MVLSAQCPALTQGAQRHSLAHSKELCFQRLRELLLLACTPHTVTKENASQNEPYQSQSPTPAHGYNHGSPKKKHSGCAIDGRKVGQSVSGITGLPHAHTAAQHNSFVHGELWPVHCSTPRYALHGPTASLYWWAITLEIWCRCVKS